MDGCAKYQCTVRGEEGGEGGYDHMGICHRKQQQTIGTGEMICTDIGVGGGW